MAGEIVINSFNGGLDTEDISATIPDNASPDLLNVNLDPQGKSVAKREGYGLYKNLPINTSTTSVHGGHKFQDSSGNNIQLWANDSEIASITSGGTPVKIATITVSATMQCDDSQGNAYCFTSARDTPIKTDGTAGGTSFQGPIPNGTMATFTPLRLAVAGVSGSPNTIHFSRSNTFTDFTTGITDPDPFTEVIASPGSRLTHIRYACGKVLWWKDQSFGWLAGDVQSDITIQIVQNDIGTLDNSSAYYNNTVWFRGQDNHIYEYDCANLTRLSRIITPTVETASRRIANSWTQSSQSDFGSGIVSPNAPSVSLSTISIPASLVVSSFVSIDSSPVQFSQGSGTNITFSTYSIRLSTNNSGSMTDPDFEGTFSTNYQGISSTPSFVASSAYTGNCTLNPQTGSKFMTMLGGGGVSDFISPRLYVNLVDPFSDSILSTKTLSTSEQSCSWTQDTFTDNSFYGKRVKFQFRYLVNTGLGDDVIITARTKSSYIFSGSFSFYFSCESDGSPGTYVGCSFDNVSGGSSTITSGSFVSRTFDTAFDSSSARSDASWSINDSTPSFELQQATTTTGPWTIISRSTGTETKSRRYMRYLSSFTIGPGDALTEITSVNILATSSGSFYSAVNNAPNISQWDVFTANENLNDGTIAYYVRSSTGIFQTNSGNIPWTSQTKNSVVSISTGIYFQGRADFSVTAATQTPTLNDFTFNWFEGSAADKAYITYFHDDVWVSVSSGTGGTNNRIQRWDTLSKAWLLDSIPANGMIVDQDRLYFGDPVQGRVFRFGDVHTDNGANFEAYWKSKDFTGSDPFVQNEFIAYDWMVAASTGNLTANYQVNASTSSSYSINLFDSSSSLVRRSNNLPPGRIGTFYNVRIGNTSDQPWEVFGHRVRYNPLSWKPQ